MTKVIVVAYSHGREGTSALMGVLRCFGFQIVEKTKPSIMNPKGFFEDPKFDDIVFQMYDRKNGDLSLPPGENEIHRAQKKASELNFDQIFADQVGSSKKFAIKAPRYLLLPLIKSFRNKYEFKVIHIKRNRKDHLNSVYRVWQQIEGIDSRKKRMSKKQLANWLSEWKKFGEHQLLDTDLSIIEIDFEQLIKNKEETIKQIGHFIDEQSIDISIFDWIDPKLVNRKKLI